MTENSDTAALAAAKTALRKAVLARRDTLDEAEAHRLSKAAQEHILASSAWNGAESVALYYAVGRETGTRLLLEAAWKQGKQALLPFMPGPKGLMHFLPCPDETYLVAGRFGIPAPDPARCALLPPLSSQGERVPGLIITPGVAFDRQGGRLGNGGGYYDRMFARPAMAKVVRIALSYELQVVDAVPREDVDMRVNALGTEKGLLWF